MLRVTILVCALVGVGLAALARAPLAPKPEKFANVAGCYIEELDAVVPPGEAAPSKTQCLEYRCGSLVTLVSCGVAQAGPGSKIVEDKEKPYPECCPQLVGDSK